MKKLLFAIAAVAVLASCSKKSTTEEPTPEDPTLPVSTDVENRTVVIEEYTGISCGYCPDGHRMVNELIAEYPEQVYGVNIHAGSYANNTYTTTEGTSYLSEAKVSGFPAGVVNRHVFEAFSMKKGGMAMSRGDFEAAAKQVMKMTSPVNINAVASIDTATRTLNVIVRGYYTSESNAATNSLYVMILQDSVIGAQSGASYNPDQQVGNKYRHMHMFRTCITGTWGDEIIPAVGNYFDRTYTYTIPAQLGDSKPIDAVLKDLKLLIFVAEGHTEILTAMEPILVLK